MLSPALTELLDRESNPDDAARDIAQTPAMREEARAALPTLKAQAERRAGEEGVRKVIARRFATFPQPERSEDEWAAWWVDYVETLADLSLACLEAAMRAYVAQPSSEFMPKPGVLRHLAETTSSRALQRYYRARRAVQLADNPPPSEAPRVVDQAQVSQVRRMFNDYVDQSMARVNPLSRRPADRPNTAGKPDAGGLTSAMRELISKRAEMRR